MALASSNLLSALYHAGQSLLRGQHRLSVLGRNVSGAGDPHYSRQTDAGVGSEAAAGFSVTRQRDLFLDRTYRQNAGDSAENDARHTALVAIEAGLGEPSEFGLSAALGRFWDGWERLSGSAADTAARTEVLGSARALADRLNAVAGSLENQRTTLTSTLRRQVQELNETVNQVADLSRRLLALRPGDSGAAVLADQRDFLLDRVAALAGADTMVGSSGQPVVVLGGRMLVMDGLVTRLELDGSGFPTWGGGDAAPVGGSMGGLKRVLTDGLPALQTELDQLADGLASEVNRLHRSGFSLDGVTGRDFFTAGGGAAGLSLVVSGTGAVAAAAADGATGDGRVAAAIAALRDAGVVIGSPLAPGESLPPERHLQAVVADLGLSVATARRSVEISGRQLLAVDQERRAVTGVSLDEEALHLVEAQKVMSAASRVVTALDDALERIINQTGRVGR